MENQGVYVGVDVSKERLEVAISPGNQSFWEGNDERAVARLVKRLHPRPTRLDAKLLAQFGPAAGTQGSRTARPADP